MNSNFKIDFVCVGAAKSGTTWLYRCIKNHPEVDMSPLKELNFFCTRHLWLGRPINHGKSIDWLRSQFKVQDTSIVHGDISPSYLADPQSPELIYNYNPKMKLIFLLRNPVDALHSLYFEFLRRDHLPGTFEQFISNYEYGIQAYKYYERILDFQKFFSSEQTLILLYDDLQLFPVEVFKQICSFLEIDSRFVSVDIEKRINARKTIKSSLLRNTLHYSNKILDYMPNLKRVIGNLGAERLAHILWNWNEKHSKPEQMNVATRNYLMSEFHNDHVKLSSLINRNLEPWMDLPVK